MSTVVTVTEEHITKGIRGSCTHCPVGRALADAFPDANVFANGATFTLYPWDEVGEYNFSLPPEAEDFIARFDEDGFGEPFTFTVDYPEVIT